MRTQKYCKKVVSIGENFLGKYRHILMSIDEKVWHDFVWRTEKKISSNVNQIIKTKKSN